MKKRVFAFLLTLAMALGLFSAPAMASVFSDITDTATARNVEVLRLMGVLEGDGTGNFRPNGTLTRGEFCKMVVVLMGNAAEAERYKTVTIFPDVRASHWAAGYINFAVRGETRLIAGLPDGTFRPNQAISFGEAVTILMRLLGYTDEDSGVVWPDGYLALAASAGLTDGLNLSGSATLTRAQAAQLFVRLLLTETKSGSKYASSVYTIGEETALVSISGTTMRTSNGKSYTTLKASSGSELAGLKGYVLTDASGKAVTFLPKSVESGAAVSDSAVIISADKSSAGLSALTGGRTDYAIYRNGVRITTSELKKNDVAIYDASSNAILVCDTRLTAYYESCEPSVTAPTMVKVLGASFNVLPSAQDSVAKFKPGRVMTLMLTADGQVASAVASDSGIGANAFAIADNEGGVQLICGTTLVDLGCTVGSADYGKVGRISSSSKTSVSFSVQSNKVSGDINIAGRTIGTKKIAENAMIVDNGKLISLSMLSGDTVDASQISYARVGMNGEVDLIVLGTGVDGTAYYGRAWITNDGGYVDPTFGEISNNKLKVEYGNNLYSPEAETGFDVSPGAYVEAIYKNGRYTRVSTLEEIKGVSEGAWIGTSAVNYSGKTYTVPSTVLCYNRDSGTWMDSIEQALAYGGTLNLYVRDGVVRVVEVRG